MPAMSTDSEDPTNHGVLSATSLARFAVCSGVPVRRSRVPRYWTNSPLPTHATAATIWMNFSPL